MSILGAECTGKSAMTQALHTSWAARGLDAVIIGEALRAWCAAAGRTPRQDEQAGIALAQTRQIAAAATRHRWVIADTTALTVAVYSQHHFGDSTLLDGAIALQQQVAFTLLMAIDLPWQADPGQRDGPRAQLAIDSLLRAALARGGIAHSVVHGTGQARRDSALNAIGFAVPALRDPASAQPGQSRSDEWNWACDRCSDPQCERRLFSSLVAAKSDARP